MITLILDIKYLNNSVQVGDIVYARKTNVQAGANDTQAGTMGTTGEDDIIGILRQININADVNSPDFQKTFLEIDESVIISPYDPVPGDFIMFSKFNQTDGDIIGYYAQARFKNNSSAKAELFSVGSEIIINSK